VLSLLLSPQEKQKIRGKTVRKAININKSNSDSRTVPKAVRRVFWRILFFYVLGSLAIGVLVASNDPHLLKAQADVAAGAARSPWVIGIQNAGIPVLPSIINAVILTSASSSANAFLYTGSRYLFALAQNRQAPRFLLRCSKAGVPYWCVAITASISGLTYLSVRSGGPSVVFGWFQNLTTIASLFTWCSICIAYIQFHKALKAQGVDRNTLVFKSRFQPYTAWSALIYFAIIIIFNGFDVFIGEHHSHWSVTSTFLPSLLR
jgi:amino acid transporter